MIRKRIHALLLLLALLATACTNNADVTSVPPTVVPPGVPPTLTPVSGSPVVISEMLAGLPGNNNAEFIELYNRTPQAVELKGYSLWYRLPSSPEDLLVVRWSRPAVIPPYGRYLLARAGETGSLPGGVTPDIEFEQPVNASAGGLSLRGPDGTVMDALGWGRAAEGFVEGEPAAAPDAGLSLGRKGAPGPLVDSDSSAADFTLTQPQPENTGSPAVPARPRQLAVRAEAAGTTTPGGEFTYTLTIENLTGGPVEGAQLIVPLPEELTLREVEGLPQQPDRAQDGTLTAALPRLDASSSLQVTVTVQAPYAYEPLRLTGVLAAAPGQPELNGYGGPVVTRVEGGQIPVAASRGLVGAELTVEGIATAYTGAYFAGSGNNKFYLQDDTGGIQVQVFGGQGQVSVRLGDRVRVRGVVGVYRDSVQIVPITVPDDVQVTRGAADAAVSLTSAAISDVLAGGSPLAGSLVEVEGDVTRVEEFTYSHEIDLTDGEQTLTLYVDKQTGVRVEAVEAGQRMAAVGVVEIRDGITQLYPRVQSDLRRIYPPVAMLELAAPVTAPPGQPFTLTLTAANHTASPIRGAEARLPLPEGARVVEILDGGALEDGVLTWDLPEIAPNGGTVTVSARLQANAGVQSVTLSGYTLAYANNAVEGEPYPVFTGQFVPIWAVQGSGDRSPYTGSTLAVEGVVTGVFPGLNGFFLQGPADGQADTSDGLFVQAPAEALVLRPGDRVQAQGLVREVSRQTTLQVDAPSALIRLGSAALPAAQPYDPPADGREAARYSESLEGMLVQVGPAVAVSPVTAYGETVLVLEKHGVDRLFQDNPADDGLAIMIDDGQSIEHDDATSLPWVISSGDRVSGVAGPLAFTFDRYKVEPAGQPAVEARPFTQPAIAPAGEGELSVMTWNVENLFDAREPNPSDPPMPRLSEYQRDLAKVANTIAAAGAPDVVAVQEVENVEVLEALAEQEALLPYRYAAYLEEGADSRGIDVGYLVRTDRVEVAAVRQYADEEGIFPRPPLLLHLRFSATGQGFYAINNHFTSMSGGVESTEPRRILQAQGNAAILAELREGGEEPLAVVLGDLNAFYHSAPIDVLRQAGLTHVLEKLPPEEQYTYVFEGESQVLDHMLATAPLFERILRVEILHINSDFPPPPPDDTSPRGKSDHDPVVVIFDIR